MAPTITAWCFQTALGAKVGDVRLRRLQDAGALEVHCAIAVTWVHGAHRPRTHHVRHWGGRDRDDPEPLASLARTILSVATSATPRSAAEDASLRLRGSGIEADFLLEVGTHFVQDRSVLLVLSGRADIDVVRPLIQRGLAAEGVHLVMAELPPDAVAHLGAGPGAVDDGPGVHPNRGRPTPEAPS